MAHSENTRACNKPQEGPIDHTGHRHSSPLPRGPRLLGKEKKFFFSNLQLLRWHLPLLSNCESQSSPPSSPAQAQFPSDPSVCTELSFSGTVSALTFHHSLIHNLKWSYSSSQILFGNKSRYCFMLSVVSYVLIC